MLCPLLLLLTSAPAHATDLDVSAAEVPGSPRMVGMAGAYRAIAEGAAAQRLNPAAIAVRGPDVDRSSWTFDGVAAARGLLPAVRALDFGALSDAPLPTIGLTGGVVLGRGQHAGALLVDWRNRYVPDAGRSIAAVEVSGGWGMSLADDHLQIGAMPSLVVTRARTLDAVDVSVAPILAAGARWDVDGTPVRLGLAARSPGRASLDLEDVDDIRLPWELGGGLAIRHGRATHGARPEERPEVTRLVQWAGDLTLTGPLENVRSVEAWAREEQVGADAPLTVTVATGLEVEAIPWWLRVRAGAYTEPARARLSLTGVRMHATLGLDIATLEWPKGRYRWTLLPVVDISALGLQPAIGIGTW